MELALFPNGDQGVGSWLQWEEGWRQRMVSVENPASKMGSSGGGEGGTSKFLGLLTDAYVCMGRCGGRSFRRHSLLAVGCSSLQSLHWGWQGWSGVGLGV